MQLVLSNNRIIAYGENFISIGGVVINAETGARYENATIAECDGCPSDIDKVGYEYHAGVFVPCAPFGVGNNNGYFMEVCEDCATPRNSGIPIKNGLTLENMASDVVKKIEHNSIKLLWTNASPSSTFSSHEILLTTTAYDIFFIEAKVALSAANGNPANFVSVVRGVTGAHTITGQHGSGVPDYNSYNPSIIMGYNVWAYPYTVYRSLYYYKDTDTGYYAMYFSGGHINNTKAGAYPTVSASDEYCIPYRIYGVKL